MARSKEILLAVVKGKIETLNKLDEQILDSESTTEGGSIDKEVDEAGKYKDDLFKAIILCEETLSSKEKEKEKEPVVWWPRTAIVKF